MPYMGKLKYYKARKTLARIDDEAKMIDFMMSDAGNYNGNAHMAALSALDHSRDYSEGSKKNLFWYDVYSRLEYISLNLINIDQVEG